MPLHAFDSLGQLIHAHQASKKSNYHCIECQQVVRLRGGLHRQSHFYHLETTRFCRQHEKGAIHLQLQSYFFEHLPLGDCRLELPFPSIRRIADVAWLSQQIVFEIQYSPISAEEVLARNRDYQQLGWTVVWILQDKRYNKMRLSAAEMALRSSPHFFSNMNESGLGMIYDQFDICDKGIRRLSLPPLPIEVTKGINRASLNHNSSYPLVLLNQRATHWKMSFAGDLMSIFMQNPDSEYIQMALAEEKGYYSSLQPCFWHLPLKVWKKAIAMPYQILFRFFLERMCR